METSTAIQALTALAHEHRLAVFRLLVRCGPNGMAAGDIARALGLAPAALSFHLKELDRAGLVRPSRDGRFIRYAPEFAAMQALLRYLTEDCCDGHPDLCTLDDPMTALACCAPENFIASKTMRKRPMSDVPYNVLFLCTHNSARSVIAEVLMNSLGRGGFKAYSAGSTPRGTVNPFALKILQNFGHDTSGLRSKSWDEFTGPEAPPIDFVFTLCDDAAAETCPVWPGKPITDHWGMPDPSRADGTDSNKLAAFANTYSLLHHHISKFVQFAKADLDRMSMAERVADFSRDVRARNTAGLADDAAE